MDLLFVVAYVIRVPTTTLERRRFMADEIKEPQKVPNRRGKGGSRKGVPNKVTALARENIITVFDRMGGISEMVDWAKANKSEFYKLYARLIPVEVTGKDGGAIQMEVGERNALRDKILEVAHEATTSGDPRQVH